MSEDDASRMSILHAEERKGGIALEVRLVRLNLHVRGESSVSIESFPFKPETIRKKFNHGETEHMHYLISDKSKPSPFGFFMEKSP